MNGPKLPLLTNRADTLKYEDGVVRILDRRRLPEETVFVDCRDYREVARAIVDMVIQGAPPLAYAAGYGLALACRQSRDLPAPERRRALEQAHRELRATRPTGPTSSRCWTGPWPWRWRTVCCASACCRSWPSRSPSC